MFIPGVKWIFPHALCEKTLLWNEYFVVKSTFMSENECSLGHKKVLSNFHIKLHIKSWFKIASQIKVHQWCHIMNRVRSPISKIIPLTSKSCLLLTAIVRMTIKEECESTGDLRFTVALSNHSDVINLFIDNDGNVGVSVSYMHVIFLVFLFITLNIWHSKFYYYYYTMMIVLKMTFALFIVVIIITSSSATITTIVILIF